MKLTQESKIKDLLIVISDIEIYAGSACYASQGTQGCHDAGEAAHVISYINNLLSNE